MSMSLSLTPSQGDIGVFNRIAEKHSAVFAADGTDVLIGRLAHNVVKAGLRRLNISYSRISLADIAERLSLGTAKSAEYIVAKAIRDGVIDGVIDHEGGFLRSNEVTDVYSTMEVREKKGVFIYGVGNGGFGSSGVTHGSSGVGRRYPRKRASPAFLCNSLRSFGQPAEAMHRRITFCLNTHAEAVKGLRYPEDAYEKANKKKGDEEEKTEEEIAAEIEEELAEEEDDF